MEIKDERNSKNSLEDAETGEIVANENGYYLVTYDEDGCTFSLVNCRNGYVVYKTSREPLDSQKIARQNKSLANLKRCKGSKLIVRQGD